MAGFLACLKLFNLPIQKMNSGTINNSSKDLQLRGQLRILTEFPINSLEHHLRNQKYTFFKKNKC